MDLTKTVEGRWPGGPRICTAVNLPAFETADGLKHFIAGFGDGAISVDRIGKCQVCGGWHAEIHSRELSGATSNSGNRHDTFKIPMEVEAHNRALSARDAEQYRKGIYTGPEKAVKSGSTRQNRKRVTKSLI